MQDVHCLYYKRNGIETCVNWLDCILFVKILQLINTIAYTEFFSLELCFSFLIISRNVAQNDYVP